MNAVFVNRRDAGKKLARKLLGYANHSQALVLGLPRGGVPIAYEIAKQLSLPLDVCLVKKLGLPNEPEVALGAIAEDALAHDYSGNIAVLDAQTVERNSLSAGKIRAIAAKVKAELKWRECCYRHYRPLLQIRGNTVILTDDGIATGLTMQAAVTVVRQQQPQKIILAIPVAAPKALRRLENLVDEIVCLLTPKSMSAVGFWYEDFSQVSDQEVCDLLTRQMGRELVANS